MPAWWDHLLAFECAERQSQGSERLGDLRPNAVFSRRIAAPQQESTFASEHLVKRLTARRSSLGCYAGPTLMENLLDFPSVVPTQLPHPLRTAQAGFFSARLGPSQAEFRMGFRTSMVAFVTFCRKTSSKTFSPHN